VTFVYPVKERPVAPKQTKVTEAHYSIEVAIHRLGHAAALLDADESRAKINAAQVKAPPRSTTRRPLRARPTAEAVT
jgi:hypothetical protein